jgi:type II secretory pathway pseudopilin PulG
MCPASLLPKNRGPRKAAFSLLEVLFAAAILVIVGGAVFTSMVRLQRHAANNRNYACAQIVLRNAIDQALGRGWSDPANPMGILAPTVTGSTSVYDTSSLGWKQWNPFSASDTADPNSVVPIYTDQLEPTRNVNGRLYRKIQRVRDNERLLWVTARIDYAYAGQDYSHQMSTVRSLD